MESGNGGAMRHPESTSRRDALKRGAVIGGLAWVAPAVQLIGVSPAHAQTASPGGGDGGLKSISFIAFRFTCADGTFFAKAENITASSFDCDGPNERRDGNCGVDQAGAVARHQQRAVRGVGRDDVERVVDVEHGHLGRVRQVRVGQQQQLVLELDLGDGDVGFARPEL
ncbi:MAG: twin-arginine translocation signal domain-containing protein, partial [Actinobacteria bacterium]|nr:twin-arginine translocation signal domain-containing protein [Actinomycetota bacterium]